MCLDVVSKDPQTLGHQRELTFTTEKFKKKNILAEQLQREVTIF